MPKPSRRPSTDAKPAIAKPAIAKPAAAKPPIRRDPKPAIAKPAAAKPLIRRDRKSFVYIGFACADKRPLAEILQEWCTKEKLKTGVRWRDLSEDQIKSITTDARANALGVPFALARRVVQKISKLVRARNTKLLGHYHNGKLVRTTKVTRVEPKRVLACLP